MAQNGGGGKRVRRGVQPASLTSKQMDNGVAKENHDRFGAGGATGATWHILSGDGEGPTAFAGQDILTVPQEAVSPSVKGDVMGVAGGNARAGTVVVAAVPSPASANTAGREGRRTMSCKYCTQEEAEVCSLVHASPAFTKPNLEGASHLAVCFRAHV